MIKLILKFVFAAAIIYWLVNKGTLDFGLIAKAFNYPAHIAGCFILLTLQAVLASYRWKKLLEVKINKTIPFLQVIKLNWIGMFFNSVLPGAVTGDLIKLVYTKDISNEFNKTFLVTSVVMDRILGLAGLITLMGLFSIFNYTSIIAISPKIAPLIHINFLLLFGVIIFITSIFMPIKVQNKLLKLTEKIPFLGEKLAKTLRQVWLIGQNKKMVTTALAISIFIQFTNVIAFWLIASPFFTQHIPMQFVFSFIPLGFIAVAVPISPAGLGVGHAIFDSLFGFFQVYNGASLFNLYFLIMITINLFGFFPYAFSGKKHQLKETAEFETTI